MKKLNVLITGLGVALLVGCGPQAPAGYEFIASEAEGKILKEKKSGCLFLNNGTDKPIPFIENGKHKCV